MNRLSLFAITASIVIGCGRTDFRNGYRPGETEVRDHAKIYHLADGLLIDQRKNGNKSYYLVESTVKDYKLTAEGLEIELAGEKAGTYTTKAAPEGYVAAWITEVPGDGPGATRFQVDDATLTELLHKTTAATTVRDVYKLKQ